MKICPKLRPGQLEELVARREQTDSLPEFKKIQAVLLLDAGDMPERITEITGIKRSRIFGLRRAYLNLGLKAVASRPRRVYQLLTRKQLKEVETWLTAGKPFDFDYNSPFWSTSILADLIWIKFQVKYKSKTSYYLLFKRVKFTFHKPGRVFERRDEAEVAKWRIEATKKVKKAWDDPDTVILAADEMILSTQTTFQKIWLPANRYPQIQISNTRKNKSIYGFLNIKTGREHAFVANWQNMHITTRMLQNIRRIYPKKDNRGNKVKGKKILLLWDNPGWHKGSQVTDYISRGGEIQVLYFPKYAPEENPQEHVWKEGRAKVTHNQFISNIDQTAKDFVAYLNTTKFKYSLLGFSPI